MGRGVDDLLKFLLEQIALCSGANFADIRKHAENFYATTSNEHFNLGDIAVSSAQSTVPGPLPEPPTVDHALLTKLWQWLKSRPDVHVEKINDTRLHEKGAENHQSTVSAQAQQTAVNEASEESYATNDVEVYVSASQADKATKLANVFVEDAAYNGLILRTTPERVWQSIAGHSVDYRRILPKEFELLTRIAAAGEHGILQHRLTVLSGQDKRSTPKRTDALHQKGYIVKSAVTADGKATSLCTLTKFFDESWQQESSTKRGQATSLGDSKTNVFRDGILLLERFLDVAMGIIKDAGVISATEFTKKLGIYGQRREVRLSSQYLYRLELIGCIQRIFATIANTEEMTTSASSLKYIKDVTPAGREAFLKFSDKEAKIMWRDNQASAQVEPNPGVDGVEGAYQRFHDTLAAAESERGMSLQTAWRPQQLLPHVIYDVVHASGMQGISSMDLLNRTVGPFSKRLIEHLLATLTDVWQESQPSHLKHLAIIRDTSIDDRALHYIYRTFPHFEKAVNSGITSWDAVNTAYKQMTKSAKSQTTDVQLDEFFFPSYRPSEFHGQHIEHKISENRGALHYNTGKSTYSRPLKRKLHHIGNNEPQSAVSQTTASPLARNFSQMNKKATPSGKRREQQHLTVQERTFLAKARKVATAIARAELRQQLGSATTADSRSSTPGAGTNSTPNPRNVGVESGRPRTPAKLDEPTSTRTLPSRKARGKLYDEAMADIIKPRAEDKTAAPLNMQQDHATAGISSHENSEQVQDLDAGTARASGTKRAADQSIENHTSTKRQKLHEPSANSAGRDVKSRAHEIYQEIVEMKRPGVYINPPRILPRSLGRPRKTLYLVIKSKSLSDLDWFRNCAGSEKITKKIPDESLSVGVNYLVRYESLTSPVLSPSLDVVTGPSRTQTSQALSRSADPSYIPVRVDSEISNEPQEVADEENNPAVHLERINESPRACNDILVDSTVNVVPEASATNRNDSILPANNANEDVPTGQPAIQHSRDNQHVIESPISQDEHTGALNYTAMASTRQGVRLTGGSVGHQRTELILQIITRAGGVFPGARAVWYPLVTAMQKTNPEAKPDRDTIDRAVKSLVRNGKLRKFTFAFKDSNGFNMSKDIICLPGISFHSDEVQLIKDKMIEWHPRSYFPETVEVDPYLRVDSRVDDSSIPLPQRRKGFLRDSRINRVAMPKRKTNPAWRKWALNEGSANLRTWDAAQREALEENITEEQRAQQFEFQLQDYANNPENVSKENRGGGHRLSRIMLRHKRQSHSRPEHTNMSETEDPRSGKITARNGGKPLTFVFEKDTLAAYQNEIIRDQAQFLELRRRSANTVPAKRRPIIKQNAWIAGLPKSAVSPSTKVATPSHSRASPSVTLMDPEQPLHESTGTFGTMFSVHRNKRPQLKIQPNIQRDFEDWLPESLEDIVANHQQSRSQNRTSDSSFDFDHAVDAVQAWERTNAEVLTSDKSLTLPRFINHTVPEPALTTPVAFLNGWRTARLGDVRVARPSSTGELSFTRNFPQKLKRPGVQPRVGGENRTRKANSERNLSAKVSQEAATSSALAGTNARQFIETVLVVRSLLGGEEDSIDWKMIHSRFPEFNEFDLHSFWTEVSQTQHMLVNQLQEAFEQEFLRAYQAGALPPVNFRDLDNYDWSLLFHWASKSVFARFTVDFSMSERSYATLKTPRPAQNGETSMGGPANVLVPKDSLSRRLAIFFDPRQTTIGRQDILFDLPFADPLAETADIPPGPASTLAVAKSYVRANILTPEHCYNPDLARSRLAPFGEATLDRAVRQLVNANIIKPDKVGKETHRRNYCMANYFNISFNRGWNASLLHDAVQYKFYLDTEFAKHGSAEFLQDATDGIMVTLTNLIASGRVEANIRLPPVTHDPSVPAINPETGERALSVWGLAEGNYKSGTFDRENIAFPVILSPMASYIYGTPLPVPIPEPPRPHLQKGTSERRIPIWCDIHDGILWEMWETVLAAVLGVVVLRTGCTAKDVIDALRGCLDVWEVELCINWMKELGVMSGEKSGHSERLQVLEWWWCVCGRAPGRASAETEGTTTSGDGIQ